MAGTLPWLGPLGQSVTGEVPGTSGKSGMQENPPLPLETFPIRKWEVSPEALGTLQWPWGNFPLLFFLGRPLEGMEPQYFCISFRPGVDGTPLPPA